MRRIDGGYRRFLQRKLTLKPKLSELRHAIGGEFNAFGIVEREMLKFYGLQSTDRLVDVGCGAGRLVAALAGWFTGSYLGTDVVGSLIAACRELAPLPEWKFVKVDTTTIPAAAQSVDIVCLFSVLTHLSHEDSYCYLEEARRVLRVGGRIVFSFLEFREKSHWRIFTESVAIAKTRKTGTLNVFLSREAIEAWAMRLRLRVVDIRDGRDPFVPLPHPIALDSGIVMEEYGFLGQAICVLERTEPS
jgi:SAM-dependent methyltransferase